MHQRNTFIKEHLDRAIANHQWLRNYYKVEVVQLGVEESDHYPLLIKMVGEEVKSHIPFRFNNAWITNSSNHQIVYNAWRKDIKRGMETYKTMGKLNNTTWALKELNMNFFGYAHTKIQELEDELLNIQHMGMATRNREKVWLKVGNQNSNFFHTSIIVQRRHNIISSINDGNCWLSSAPQITKYFIKEFDSI